jgi:hypothetical protein
VSSVAGLVSPASFAAPSAFLAAICVPVVLICPFSVVICWSICVISWDVGRARRQSYRRRWLTI